MNIQKCLSKSEFGCIAEQNTNIFEGKTEDDIKNND